MTDCNVSPKRSPKSRHNGYWATRFVNRTSFGLGYSWCWTTCTVNVRVCKPDPYFSSMPNVPFVWIQLLWNIWYIKRLVHNIQDMVEIIMTNLIFVFVFWKSGEAYQPLFLIVAANWCLHHLKSILENIISFHSSFTTPNKLLNICIGLKWTGNFCFSYFVLDFLN